MSDVSVEKLERIEEVMRLIRADCEADALAIDGKPFDGRAVGEQFGNILASVAALAKAVEALASAQAASGVARDGEET